MPPNVTNKPFTKPPTENELLAFIKTLGYDEDPKQKMTVVSHFIATRLYQPWRAILSVLNRCLTGKDTSFDRARLSVLQILWGIVHSANLDFASLIWDEFEWQALDRMTRPTKKTKLIYPRFTKLIIDHFLSTNKNGEFKFGMEIPDTMINDAIKQSAGYKVYQSKKKKSEEDNAQEESEEQNVSTVTGRKRTITYADNLLETEDEAVLLAKSVSTEEQRRQQQGIMTQLVIEKEANIEVEEAFPAKKGKKLKGIATEDPTVQSILDLQKGSKESKLESIRQEIEAGRREGSSAAKDGEFEYFLDTDSDATTSSSWSSDGDDTDDDKDDAKVFNMDISDDDSDKGDDDAAGFRVFMYDKTKKPPKFTPISPAVTCSSMKDYINLRNDQPENKLTDLMRGPVYTETQTTFVVANPEGNPEEMFEDAVDHQVSSPPATTTHNLITNPQQSSIQAKAKKLITKARHTKLNFKKAVEKKFKEYYQKLESLSTINVFEVIEETVQAKNNQIILFTTPSLTTTNDLLEMELKIKMYYRMYQNKSFDSRNIHQQLHNILFKSISLDLEYLSAQDIELTLRKRPHDDQDPPNDREGEKRSKRRKDARESSSKSERKSNWFKILLKSNIDPDEDCILGLLTVTVAKKDELTIANLEGAGLEMLKRQYKNYVELEYHVDQLKAAMTEEAQWSNGDNDLSKPRSFEKQMSKSAKPDNRFYNNDFYYLSKEVYLYHVDALNGIHHWDDMRKDFFKAEMGLREASPPKVGVQD
ncbi:hypothetical protein Tco_0639238, partial [Tanacetum coccineum]